MECSRFTFFLILMSLLTSCNKKMIFIEDQILNNEIICSLEFNKKQFIVGETMALFFIITNNSSKNIFVNDSPYKGFEIEVKTAEGQILNKVDGVDMRSGRYGIKKIKPNERIKIRIHNLFKYGITENQGEYTITIVKEMPIYLSNIELEKYQKTKMESFDECLITKKKEVIKARVLNAQ